MHDSRETLPVGSVLQGRYLVEKLLGRGGFSAVYLVKDQRVRENRFALKEVIDPDRHDRERFTFEADLLRSVDHPSLPRVYRVFQDDAHERAYMLMDYIEGPNLEQLRRKQKEKRFSVQEVLRIMEPIMKAVAFLHQQQPPIIHRDIKPANIIVPTSGDEAVLVDFGIAKAFDPESTTTAIRHASPGYGALEQYATGTNTRTDLYGLGATMYALLTGVVPTDAFFRMTRLGGRGVDPLEPIQNYAPNVPQYMADAIYRAMALDINQRFPTVQEFWYALNNPPPVPIGAAPIRLSADTTDAQTPLPLPGEATSPTNRRGDRRSRRRVGAWLPLLLVVLIGILLAALFISSLLSHQTHQTNTPAISTSVTHVATSTASPTPTATATSRLTSTTIPGSGSGYPVLEKQYNGTIHNSPAGQNAGMTLNGISQNKGNIQGAFQVSNPLSGSGPFSGTVSTSGVINFTVNSNQVSAPLRFQGNIRGDGSLAGTYCSLNSLGKCDTSAGGFGTWQVFTPKTGS